ncbi:hypothetical protein BGZ81_004385 [Podila clonocystis]|nr:hypothetical protein BGZ81_004385 [Podila clonocystis]
MFKNATSEFKKRMAEQPLIQRPVIAPMASGHDERIYTGSDANPNNNGLQSFTPSKKRKTEVFSQPKDTGTGKHIKSILVAAISYLKSVDEPQTADDIKRKGGVDLAAHVGLYQLLKDNEKIDFDPVNGTYLYKLNEAVNELAAEGRILVVRNKDGAPRVLFWNDQRYNTAMDPMFREIWHSLRIPDEIDLPKELEKAGLTHMQVFDKKGPGEMPKRKTARKNRKMKITNTHMTDLDLTKDFVLQK